MLKFIKQHKILLLIFIISIFLMIKNSKIPYPFDPPDFVAFIFDSPNGGFFSGVLQMLDIFASAYVTSLIFYFMVDYIPAQKEEKKAKDIVEPQLVSLYQYISTLLEMIKFAAKQEKIYSPNNMDDMDNLHIENKVIYCKEKSFKNEIQQGVIPYKYNLLLDSYKYKTLIINTCSKISHTPCFFNCESQIVHIISEIQLSELILMLPNPNDFIMKLDYTDVTYMGLGKKYAKLVSIYKKLAKFVDTRLSFQMIEISNEEIEKWEIEQAELLQNNPMIERFLNDMQCIEK